MEQELASKHPTWPGLTCAKCAAAAAMPYRATCVGSAVQVDIRCPNCQYEWQVMREEFEAISDPRPGITH